MAAVHLLNLSTDEDENRLSQYELNKVYQRANEV